MNPPFFCLAGVDGFLQWSAAPRTVVEGGHGCGGKRVGHPRLPTAAGPEPSAFDYLKDGSPRGTYVEELTFVFSH